MLSLKGDARGEASPLRKASLPLEQAAFHSRKRGKLLSLEGSNIKRYSPLKETNVIFMLFHLVPHQVLGTVLRFCPGCRERPPKTITTTSGSELTWGTETEHLYTLLGEEQHENDSFFGVQLPYLMLFDVV